MKVTYKTSDCGPFSGFT